MNRRVFIRVDASAAIGLGHLARCLSLAGAIAEAGAEPMFFVRDPAPSIGDRIASAGFACVPLPAAVPAGFPAEAEIMLDHIRAEPRPPVLIADHYAIDASWERLLRPEVARLAVIDDLADRPHDCDLLIDQNRMCNATPFHDAVVPADTQRLTGPRYAMLRPEFAAWRQKPRTRDGTVRTILVCFGGSDPAGHTITTMQALEPHLHRLERIDVVVGPLNPASDEIGNMAAASSRFQVSFDAANMGELLFGADLAIGGGGIMSWERACLGVPSLMFGIVPNQAQNIRDLLRAGAGIGVAEMHAPRREAIANWIGVALETPDLLRGLGERSRALVDGLGSRRVASHLVRGSLHFRPARRSDSALIHAWRNHPAVRSVSGNSAGIPWEEHDIWFERSLNNPDRLILVAERAESPVGVARFDISGRVATISVYKDPNCQGPIDLVGQATRWLFDNRGEIDEIAAVVLAHNERSARAFETAGYELRDRRFVAARIAGNVGEGLRPERK